MKETATKQTNGGTYSNVVKKLVEELELASKTTQKGKAYMRVYDLYDSTKQVVGWRFNEWDYQRNNVRLPCNARGLFISNDAENPEIVARGYDKFFNIDEVLTTKWEWINQNTTGPYEVTLKSNGCIILVSGLNDGTLVVCSKHSTGPRDDVDRNHAKRGRDYILSQLKAKGIDAKELAKELHDLKVTAVAEYCDDSFEEHILEYKGENAGLYLHGINNNTPGFKTWPMNSVNEFALKYGFKTTEYLIKTDISSLKVFLEECAESGSYNDTEVEGFVIRAKLKDSTDFFFKYKFEEPYLMYRQWREVTKDYITTKSRIFNFRKHKFITNKYLDFVIPLLDKDQKMCDDYLKGFGIIELRNMFLKNYGMSGIEILNYAKVCELEMKNSIDFNKTDEHTKFLIIPIAVIGCGKTTTALTLKNLYPTSWDVVQNDNITSKDKSLLIKESLQLLAQPDIKCVIVDRNNHQFRERKQLFDWIDEFKEVYLPYDTNIKVIGLSFFPYDDIQDVRELTISRVLARGDNHQSIKSSTYGEKKVLGIMNGFINRFQPVNPNKSPDDMFDLIINLKVSNKNSSYTNAYHIIEEIHRKYPPLISELPQQKDLMLAFEKSLEYKPSVVKIVKSCGFDSKTKKFKPSFFSATLKDKESIIKAISDLLKKSQVETDAAHLIARLFKEDKFQKEFHVTLAHISQGKNGTAAEKGKWNKYMNEYQDLYLKTVNTGEKPKFIISNNTIKLRLKKLCWDNKIVSIIVDFSSNTDTNYQTTIETPCCNKIPHITIALLDDNTRPYYSNELCNKVLDTKNETNIHHLDFDSDLKEFEANICINL